MDLEKLRGASTVLQEASESATGEVAERLESQAASLASFAEGDRGPDHGQVARHQETLRELKAEEPAVADPIEEAYDLLNEYRETVEGV